MAKKDAYDKKHDVDTSRIQANITRLYNQFVKEVAQLSNLIEAGGGIPEDKPFRLEDYPATKARLNKLIKKLAKEIDLCVVNGIKSQWTLANNKNNELCNVVFGALVNKLTKEQKRYYYTNNAPALKAFLLRKNNGLGLSQQVWNYVDESRAMIEASLELGLKTGESAAEIASDLRQYLRFPDKLFRRVRDEEGRLHLSKNAAAFHPGQGVYRSSYKNAMRLSRTETNMAYRTADHLRHAQLDFVVGIEIHLSNNHTCLDSKGRPQPFFDICDELQGKYPKQFDFKGWHPQCRCFVTTILKTPEEVMRDADGIDRGSVNEVKKMPEQWEDWLERNRDRIDAAEARGKLPYFLRDNEWAWNDDVEMPGTHKNAQQQAIIRHASRTPEQIEDIKRRWNERQIAYNDAKTVLKLLDSVPELEEYWKGTVKLAGYKTLREMYETGNRGKYKDMRALSEAMLNSLKGLRDEFKILDNPWEVVKKYNPFRAMNARDNALKTMSKYDGYTDEQKIDKYRYEADYIEKYKKGAFSTWEVVRDAYLKAARALEWEVIWKEREQKLDDLAASPYAPAGLVDHARTLFKHDQAAFDDVISDIEKEVEWGKAKERWDNLLNKYPKLLEKLDEDRKVNVADKDTTTLDYYIKMATIITDQWEQKLAIAESYLNDSNIGPSTKKKIRDAIDKQNLGGIDKVLNGAETERKVAIEAKHLLQPEKAKILLALGQGDWLDLLDDAMASGDYNAARTFVDALNVELKKWEDLEETALDLWDAVPDKYKKAIDEALDNIDKPALEVAISRARTYRDVIKPLVKRLDAFEKDTAKFKGILDARKQELKDERDEIASRKKLAKLMGDDAIYRAALDDAKKLREKEARLEEASLSFKSWGTWIADGRAAADDEIIDALREAVDELGDTEAKIRALGSGGNVSINPNALGWELDINADWSERSANYEKFLNVTFDAANEAFKKMTWEQKKNIWSYTDGSGKFNRPLEGYAGNWWSFKGKGNVPFDYEGADADGYKKISTALEQCHLPEDMWLYHGGDYQTFRGIFGTDPRGMSESDAKAKYVGASGTRESFSSCSPTSPWHSGKDILFHIYCPKGTEAMVVSPMSRYCEVRTLTQLRKMKEMSKTADFGEKEILLNRGYTFRILDIRKNKTLHWDWVVDVIVTDRNNRYFD